VNEQFTARLAESNRRRYERRGPNPTTRFLRDGVIAAGGGRSVLDIGAGIGALSLELLARGFTAATLVEASPAYAAAARKSAAERGLAGQVDLHTGDFVELASRLAPADAVVLDRVVCCYPAYGPLLEAAIACSRRLFGYSYPRERWDVRGVIGLENTVRRWTGGSFRAFVHPEAGMSAVLVARGFRRVSRRQSFAWCADVYARDGA
jgi:magnesium-protoporphyrin O-methyltransferase